MAWVAAATASTTESATVTQLGNSYSTSVMWLLLSNSHATSLIWSAHTVSLACCDHPHRSFCQFCCTTWTLLLVVSLLLLRDSGTLFHWTVELLHPLTHLRSVSRHFSLIWHNRTVARTSGLRCDINWLIDRSIDHLSSCSERSTANQPERCCQANCSRVGQRWQRKLHSDGELKVLLGLGLFERYRLDLRVFLLCD